MSATKKLVDHMERCIDIDSSDDESDSEEEEEATFSYDFTQKTDDSMNTQSFIQPTSAFSFVTRLSSSLSLSKMNSDEEIRMKVMAVCANQSEPSDVLKMMNDSNDKIKNDNKVVVSPSLVIPSEGHSRGNTDLDDIRQQVLEYERQQLKGVQLFNAGGQNPKILNNYAVTSNTCTLI